MIAEGQRWMGGKNWEDGFWNWHLQFISLPTSWINLPNCGVASDSNKTMGKTGRKVLRQCDAHPLWWSDKLVYLRDLGINPQSDPSYRDQFIWSDSTSLLSFTSLAVVVKTRVILVWPPFSCCMLALWDQPCIDFPRGSLVSCSSVTLWWFCLVKAGSENKAIARLGVVPSSASDKTSLALAQWFHWDRFFVGMW